MLPTARPSPTRGFAGFLLIVLLAWELIMRKEGMGMGDVKLAILRHQHPDDIFATAERLYVPGLEGDAPILEAILFR